MKKILFPLLFVLFVACTQDNPKTDGAGVKRDFGTFVVKEGVLYYDANHCRYVRLEGENKLVIDMNMPEEYVPKTGSIVVCPQTEQTPEGFMGRVISIDGNTYSFSEVTLEEVFETLSLDTETDITTGFGEAQDDEGNPLMTEVIESSVWDGFDYDYQEEKSLSARRTKAPARKTLAVEIVNDYFNGKLLSTVSLDSRIQISGGKLRECHLEVHRRSALEGELSVSKDVEASSDKLLKTVNFPLGPGIVVGPLVLRPTMKLSAGINIKGQAAISGGARMELENATYIMDYVDGEFVCKQEAEPGKYHLSLSLVEIEAHITPFLKGGLQIALFQEKLLSAGIEVGANLKMEVETAFHLEDADLLLDNPTVNITPELTTAAYLSSMLLGKLDKEDGRIQVSKTIAFPLVELPLLPTFKDGKVSKAPDSFKVRLSSDRQSLMNPQEIGVACFAEGRKEPLQMFPLTGGLYTKASSGPVEIVYEGDADYAKPYVKTSDGTVYFGKKMGTRYLKSFTAYFNGTASYSYQFIYDNNKCLKEALGNLYGNFRFTYTDDHIIIESFDGEVTSLWASYLLDDSGRVIRKDDNDPTTFFYKDGWICGTGYDSNLYVSNGVDFTEYYGHDLTYTDIEDSFNLNIFTIFLITDFYVMPVLVRLPGLWSTHLPATLDETPITYHIEDGLVKSFDRNYSYESEGVVHNWNESYVLEYYD